MSAVTTTQFGMPSPASVDRHLGLGGSDMPAILGLVPQWRTKLGVYMEKIGEAPPKEDTIEMFRGRLFEPAIIEEYERIMGCQTTVPDGPITHPTVPYLRGNVDRIVSPTRIAEAKATRHPQDWGEAGTDQVPEPHAIQGMTYLSLEKRWEVCDVVVCFVSEMVDRVIERNINDLPYLERFVRDVVATVGISIYPVLRDQRLCDFIAEEAKMFWEMHVLPRVPPLPTTVKEAQQVYRATKGKAITADKLLLSQCDEHEQLGQDIKTLEDKRDKLHLAIVTEMKDADTILRDGKVRMTWHESRTQRFDFKRFKDEQPEQYLSYCYEANERRLLHKRIKP